MTFYISIACPDPDNGAPWSAVGEGETITAAYRDALANARAAADSIREVMSEHDEEKKQPKEVVEGIDQHREPDSQSQLWAMLPKDIRENANLYLPFKEIIRNNTDAKTYMKSPHRMDFLVRSLRKSAETLS